MAGAAQEGPIPDDPDVFANFDKATALTLARARTVVAHLPFHAAEVDPSQASRRAWALLQLCGTSGAQDSGRGDATREDWNGYTLDRKFSAFPQNH
jgi:hypothetical protein